MSVPFNTILRNILRHVNGIAGAQIADAEAAYLTNPLTTTAADNPRYNLSFVKDVMIDVHGRLALAIATTADPVTGIGCHPWRSFFSSVTPTITDGAVLPKQDAATKELIGALGRARDATDADLLFTPASAERVSQYKQFGPTFYTVNPYFYHINGSIVYHTATSGIVFECCVYRRDDVATLVTSNSNIQLPDILSDALVAGTVASLLIESEYADQSAFYMSAYMAALQEIASGSIAMPGLGYLSKGSQT